MDSETLDSAFRFQAVNVKGFLFLFVRLADIFRDSMSLLHS